MIDIGGYVTAEIPVKITDRKQTKKERIKQLEAELARAHSHATPPIVFVYEEQINDLRNENKILSKELERLREELNKITKNVLFLYHAQKGNITKGKLDENYQS